MAFHAFKEKKKMAFFFSHVDHACVFNLKEDLEVFGHEVYFFGVNEAGNFDQKKLINDMLEARARGLLLVMNYTTINNETGVVWPLELAAEIKAATGAFVHVDAVQLVGKIKNWKHLDSHLDAYTFSGHKFGSMKGLGFSFVRKSAAISPLIVGGTQQQGMRAGTENAIGIYSLKLALEEFIERYNADELEAAKNYLEKNISDFVGTKGEIVGSKNQYRNLNTLFLMLKGHKAEMLSMRFDMNGIDLSTGSACSSGVIKENRILMSMGYASEDSRSAIRFSFSPFMTMEEAHVYFDKIKKVLGEILK